MTDAQVDRWTPELMMKLRQVGSVQVSPDDRRVVFTVTDALMERDKSEYRTRIYLNDLSGSDLIVLTSPATSSFDPQWSPDGASIAFISDRSGENDLWLIRVDGGEAQQLTNMPTGVSSFKWSPDGQWIAFTSVDPSLPEEEQAKEEKNDARVVGENVRMNHLHLLSVQAALEGAREPRRLTQGDFTVGVADIPAVYDWSPDSRTIAFTHTRTPSWDDWPSAGISLVDLESNVIRPLLCEAPAAIDPHFSPDGRSIVCKVYDEPAWEWSSVAHVVPLDGGPVRAVASTHDRRPDVLGWSADGTRIYFREACGTRECLCVLPVDGSPPQVLYQPEGVLVQTALNASRTSFGFVLESSSAPPEAHVSRVHPWHPIQVSWINREFRDVALAKTQVVRWLSQDGLEIEGLLTYPLEYEPGRCYPLIVSVHGGPASVFAQGYSGRPSIYGALAALSARGYAILRPNVRGSTGYGKAFRRANYRDWGGMDLQDLITGVDNAISLEIADPKRLGILGWSYGGFLAASAITQPPSETKGWRFRAAVVGAGITNLISNAGSCDSPSFTVSHFGGELWEFAELLCARSPALNVVNATTPTLILHGEQDARVPLSQGREFYNALKRCGCTVQMVVYPRTGHVPREPKLLQDVMTRTLAWMDRHLMKA
jgi:dipeptidyl aminopeptidase/acylaminoacyl peptidase